MLKKITCVAAMQYAIIAGILLANTASCDDKIPIPEDKAQVEAWFKQNVQPFEGRKATLNGSLAAAEEKPIVIKVRQDGTGNFKTLTEAIASIPTGNSHRLIVDIGPGKYVEKLAVDRSKPFVTFYGSPDNMPILSFNGDAAKYGTVYSGTLEIESDFFVGVNLVIENTSPAPDGKRDKAQAIAARVNGDKATFYNCKFIGFQDTLCDDRGRHFYKDCFIQGTVDFIFGDGRSIYLNTELNVVPSHSTITVITAQARDAPQEDTGYSFVHCKITGKGTKTELGRAWMSMPRVSFAYTEMSDIIKPQGWRVDPYPERARTVKFQEYKNTGPGSDPSGRAPFVKQLSDAEAKPIISLQYIEGSTWLLPPPILPPQLLHSSEL